MARTPQRGRGRSRGSENDRPAHKKTNNNNSRNINTNNNNNNKLNRRTIRKVSWNNSDDSGPHNDNSPHSPNPYLNPNPFPKTPNGENAVMGNSNFNGSAKQPNMYRNPQLRGVNVPSSFEYMLNDQFCLTRKDLFDLLFQQKKREELVSKRRSRIPRYRTEEDLQTILEDCDCEDCKDLASFALEKFREAAKLKPASKSPPFGWPSFSIKTPAPWLSPKTAFSDNMASPTDQFLEIGRQAIRAKSKEKLREAYPLDLDNLDDSAAEFFGNLHMELGQRYPAGKEDALYRHCQKVLVYGDLEKNWESFNAFVKEYLVYVRDYHIGKDQEKSAQIAKLENLAVIALGDTTYGYLILGIVFSLSRVLSRFAIYLDQNRPLVTGGSKSVDFIEQAANILREAFIKCLSGGLSASVRTTAPGENDKRIGIYLTANACLKLLFYKSRKLRNAQQIFLSIDAQSPLLSFYPTAQRVTYLYYLGRYHFANSHFHRAALCLEAAYKQCHVQALKHRSQILVHLIASNIILGRFPSSKLLMRREASEIAKRFLPLCKIIAQGDLGAFHQYLELRDGNETAQWFLNKRVLLQLRNRCEILIWRSLIRKTFVLVGFHGEDKKVPFVKLDLVKAAARWSMDRMAKKINAPPQSSFGRSQNFSFALGSSQPPPMQSPAFAFGAPSSSATSSHPHSSSSSYTDPDFADLSAAVAETGFDTGSETYPHEPSSYSTTQFQATSDDKISPTTFEIESIIHSLISQGLLRGFVTHNNPRFAVAGAAQAGGWKAKGFPSVWSIISAKEDEEEVPGWVTNVPAPRPGTAAMGGRVINLSGAKAVGQG